MTFRRIRLRIEKGWRVGGKPEVHKRRLLIVRLGKDGAPPRLMKSLPRWWGL